METVLDVFHGGNCGGSQGPPSAHHEEAGAPTDRPDPPEMPGEEGEGGGASRLKYTLKGTQGGRGQQDPGPPPLTCKSHVPQTYPHGRTPQAHTRLQTCSLVGLASASSVHAPLPSAVTIKGTAGRGWKARAGTGTVGW